MIWAWMETSEGGDGFVADDEGGADGESPCDADALALAAAKLVGVTARHFGVKANDGEQLCHSGAVGRPALGESVDDEGLADDLPGGHARIQ